MEQEVARLRAALEAERESFRRELEAGAAELARQDERIAELRQRLERLRRRVGNVERVSEQRRLRVRELEEERALATGSRLLRLIAGPVRAARRRRDGPT